MTRMRRRLGVIADITPARLAALRTIGAGSLDCDVRSFNWLKWEGLIDLAGPEGNPWGWRLSEEGRFLLKRIDLLREPSEVSA